MDEKQIISVLGDHWSKNTPFTGWITPLGTYAAVQNYQHFNSLENDPRYAEILEAYREAEEKERENQADWREAADRDNDGHMAWHAYDSEWESVMDSIRKFVLDTAYNDGYIRFYIDRQRKRFNVEGTSATIQKNRLSLHRITKAYDDRYELEINPVQVKQWTTRDMLFVCGLTNEFTFYEFNKEFPNVEQN